MRIDTKFEIRNKSKIHMTKTLSPVLGRVRHCESRSRCAAGRRKKLKQVHGVASPRPASGLDDGGVAAILAAPCRGRERPRIAGRMPATQSRHRQGRSPWRCHPNRQFLRRSAATKQSQFAGWEIASLRSQGHVWSFGHSNLFRIARTTRGNRVVVLRISDFLQ